MTTTHIAGRDQFTARTADTLRQLEDTGQLKHLQMIDGPMDAIQQDEIDRLRRELV